MLKSFCTFVLLANVFTASEAKRSLRVPEENTSLHALQERSLYAPEESLGLSAQTAPTCDLSESKSCRKYGGYCTTDMDTCKAKGLTFIEKGCTVFPSSSQRRCGCCIKNSTVDPKNVPTRKVITLMGNLDGGAPDFLNDNKAGHLSALLSEEEDGSFLLRKLAFVKSYDQAPLAPVRGVSGETISFEMSPSTTNRCYLGKSCHIKLEGYVHSDNVDLLYKPQLVNHAAEDKREDAVFESRQIKAQAQFELIIQADGGKARGQLMKADWSTQETVHGLSSVQHLGLLQKEIGMEAQVGESPANANDPLLELVIAPVTWFEWRRNICVQPVRVRNRNCQFWIFGICINPTYTYSGAGLGFGKPGADFQWRKADVTFTWKPWVTIVDNSKTKVYETLSVSEMSSLRAKVNSPNCVEVFFVKKFSPSDTYGGGACWSSGTANAKIVTSDEQVSCGVDKTHLAHELGHAIGLMHPNTGHATWKDGSTGTLMCPSGWQRDNPRRNSWENKSNIQNPLLVYYLAPFTWFPSPNCSNSNTCGSCAAHVVNDPCN